MKVLFLAPYPANEAPSQRYRLEHYLSLLEAAGIRYEYHSFIDKRAWTFFFKPGHITGKVKALLLGFFRRWLLMFRIGGFDYVYIHREAAPLGPPLFEWIIARVFRKRIIYDFDDAIWIPAVSQYNRMALRFKWFSKVAAICRMATTVTAGNEYLADFARKHSRDVRVIPTVVNTEATAGKQQEHQTDHPAIGWTGTLTTLKFLDIVLPVLQRLQEKTDFTFVVIANSDPHLPLRKYRFIQWKAASEADDLLQFHIGLMPLYDGELEKGKCGFKAIQYMSLGIPALVSPVGVNTRIVTDGLTGYTCNSEQDWEDKINLLLQDSRLRRQLGQAARKRVEEQYSVQATWPHFLSLFQQ